MDRRLLGVAALAIVAVGLLVVFLGTPGPTSLASQAPPSTPTGPSPTPGPTADAKAPLIKPITVVDGLFDAQPKRSVLEPTRSKNQSKLFFAYGSWWGVLQEPRSREAHIMRLDWATQLWHDTGTVVDERSFARADVVFAGDKLYVASAGGGPSPLQAVRVSVFDYDKTTTRWTREPDYPVTVNPAGVVSVLIEHAADGTLWVTYVESGQLFVSHSVGDAHHWVAPYQPTGAASATSAASDQVGMVAVGGDVVLIWSAIHDEAIYSTTHHDGTPDDAWTPASVILKGLALADDHVNVKALPDGRLFAAVKTSLDTVPNAQPGWDQVILLDRKGADWSSQQFGQIHDKHTRPIVLLDTAQNEVLVFATAPTGGGAIYMKAAPFDNIQLPVGLGAEVISSSADPRITDATSTKQTVDATTGLVVLAADNTTGRYLHLAASLGGPEPGGAAVQGGAPPAGPVIAPATPTDLVFEPMEAFTPGTPIQSIWQTSTTRDSGTVKYVARAPGDVAAQAVTTSTGELRPCRTFATTDAGTVTITMAVRLDRQGANDTTLIMARGAGQELASIRVDRRLRFRISRVGKRETTTLLIRPGAWYRITLRLDVSHHTFETFILDAAGHTLLRRPAQPWRAPKVASTDAVCVSPSVGTVGASMSFDDLRVTRTP